MKKLLTLIFAILMSLSVFGCGETPDNTGGNPEGYVKGTEGLVYMVNSDNKSATFNGIGTATGTEITIASHYEGVPVTKIKRAALYENETIVKVNIPKQMKVIGPSAFSKATKLESIVFASGIELEEIGAYSFKDCSSLQNLEIPSSVKLLGEKAFDGCPNFKLNDYEGGSYLGSSTNPYIVLMRATNSDVTNLKVSKDCRIIYADSFYNCTKLENITFESDTVLTTIGNNAFSGCVSLKEVTIPTSVEKIGASAFGARRTNLTVDNEGCSSLTKVTFKENSKLTSLGEHAFDKCTSLTEVVGFENTKLTEVTSYTFFECTSLQTIKLPKSVQILNKWVFARCKKLNVDIFATNGSLQKIEQGVFREMPSYDYIVIPKSVTYIGDLCFAHGSKPNKIIYLLNDNVSELHPNWNVYDGNGNRLTYYVYSETSKTGCWRYVNGMPTPW